MKIVRDCFGRSVRLTDERLAHILQHQEMTGMEAEIERVLQAPAEVRRISFGRHRADVLRVLCANACWWEMALCRGKVPVR